jgi:superfamily II DNA/RNA helicase
VGALHGDMAQPARFATLEKFKAGELRLLVCSDVAARGIDIGGLSHVFNFDVPHHAEDYVHRIGRTGRAGREGHAYTLASPEDRLAVEAIEKADRGHSGAMEWEEGRPHRGKSGDSKSSSGGKSAGLDVVARQRRRRRWCMEPEGDEPQAPRPRWNNRARSSWRSRSLTAPMPGIAVGHRGSRGGIARRIWGRP